MTDANIESLRRIYPATRHMTSERTIDIVVLRESEVRASIPSEIRRLPGFPVAVAGVKGRFYWRRQIVDFLEEIYRTIADDDRRRLLGASGEASHSAFATSRRVMTEVDFLAMSQTHDGGLLTIDQLARVSVPVIDMRHSTSGVYFLWRGNEVVYVGQSRVGYVRILTHLQNRAGEFDAVSFVRCTIEELDTVERSYIDAFLPELNADPITMKAKRDRARIAASYRVAVKKLAKAS